jgi:hypothetical protein
MKKIVLVLLVVMMAVGTAFAADGKTANTKEIDLHPYGGKGVMYIQGDNAWIEWDNGSIYFCPEGTAKAWREMI